MIPVSLTGGREHRRWLGKRGRARGAPGGGDRPAAAVPASRGRLLVRHRARCAVGAGRVPEPSPARGALPHESPAILLWLLDHLHARPGDEAAAGGTSSATHDTDLDKALGIIYILEDRLFSICSVFFLCFI